MHYVIAPLLFRETHCKKKKNDNSFEKSRKNVLIIPIHVCIFEFHNTAVVGKHFPVFVIIVRTIIIIVYQLQNPATCLL